jgi:ADP-ribose pyrophosphatase
LPADESRLSSEEWISSRPVYQGRIVDLTVDQVRLAGGRDATREVIGHAGAVVILAVDGDDNVLFVRQYRYPTGRVLLELPAGTLDPEEEPLHCATRELAEETGFRAGRWHKLGGFFSAPGYCTEYLHAFLATELKQGEPQTDDDEEIESVMVPLTEVWRLVERGEVEDAKSLATLLLFARMREGR